MEEEKEYIGMYVSKKVAKEIELAKDNQRLRESILQSYFKNEKGFIEDEIREIDDVNLRYKAKLLEIRDNFAQSQKGHEEVIDSIYQTAIQKLKPVELLLTKIEKDIERVSRHASEIGNKISYANASGLEKLMEALNQYARMNKDQKDLIKLIISKES